MRSLASIAAGRPNTDSSPRSGNRIDMIILSVVVLPAPFGPMKPYSAPIGTVRSRLSTATVAPKVFVTPVKTMACPIGLRQVLPEGVLRLHHCVSEVLVESMGFGAQMVRPHGHFAQTAHHRPLLRRFHQATADAGSSGGV